MGLFRSYAKFKIGKKVFDTVVRQVRSRGRAEPAPRGRRRVRA
jgi:hypothetical protein